MNLIEKLGLEKCKAIVDGAPENSQAVVPCSDGEMYFAQRGDGEWLLYSDVYQKWLEYCGWCDPMDVAIKLSDICAAIAEHDQYWYGQSEEKELEQYALLSQEKIEGGAMLVGDFKNNLTSSEYKNCFQAERMRTVVNIGTAIANHTDNFSHFDHCSDIRNHISPNTVVIER